jgi:ABC-2 type transport system ATP-binding protein
MVDVRGLRKQFGDLTAVDGVSFRVEPGEVFGILGPNGAGKTTTLEIVETLQRPTAGDVFVAGFDALREPEQVKARIGVQLQSASFYPDLSLVDLLKLFAALYDVPVDPMAMLRRFQLEEKAKVAIDKLSGGQRQRFSLATTLLNRPDVIFLDEPTTGLDPQARLNLWDLNRDVQSGGTTFVHANHYKEEAEPL